MDAIGWKEVATVGGIMLAALLGFTVHILTSRLDKHEREDRENFISLFKGQESIAEKISTGFRELDQTINTIHVKLLEQINSRGRNHDEGHT